MARLIPEDERLLLIEDTAEIQIHHSNLVRLEARPAQNGVPAVTIRDLLKAALRHRPDRILLGEVRGSEAFDLLQLLNTGHAGTISTIHANSAREGLSRFTSCVLQSGIEVPYRAIKSSIADSLNVALQATVLLIVRGGTLFFATDGVRSDFSMALSARENPQGRQTEFSSSIAAEMTMRSS
jgi:pilus assembly protein CpaF